MGGRGGSPRVQRRPTAWGIRARQSRAANGSVAVRMRCDHAASQSSLEARNDWHDRLPESDLGSIGRLSCQRTGFGSACPAHVFPPLFRPERKCP